MAWIVAATRVLEARSGSAVISTASVSILPWAVFLSWVANQTTGPAFEMSGSGPGESMPYVDSCMLYISRHLVLSGQQTRYWSLSAPLCKPHGLENKHVRE